MFNFLPDPTDYVFMMNTKDAHFGLIWVTALIVAEPWVCVVSLLSVYPVTAEPNDLPVADMLE